MDEPARREAAPAIDVEAAREQVAVGLVGEEEESRLDAVDLAHQGQRPRDAAEDEDGEKDVIDAADAAVRVEQLLIIGRVVQPPFEDGIAIVEVCLVLVYLIPILS